MSPLVIRSLGAAFDLVGTAPKTVCELSLAEIRRLPVRQGNRDASLGDLCDVSGDPRSMRWRLEGDWSRVTGVGAGMAAGEIVVAGAVGRHAGEGMTGGMLAIDGDAGDWLGAEMRGGIVRVAGNAGDHVGGALAGSRRGMAGGAILVAGNVGDFAGERMRRGLVAVGGDTGDWLACGMHAGTVIVWGACGAHLAAEMIRGTVAALGPTPSLGATFRAGSTAVWPMLPLLRRELESLGFAKTLPLDPLQIVHGDFLRGGRGEVLLAA
ncbi:MAG: formylmethanofuran dehydrogenase subunit C [Pirellulales bacterium]|nr:formylmethanofuran dehydrogenase subunit C [Pirellulales bacterium]